MPAKTPTHIWAMLAAVCAAALLFSFGHTVQQIVAQGAERRAHDQQTAQILARCNTIADRTARDECRAVAR